VLSVSVTSPILTLTYITQTEHISTANSYIYIFNTQASNALKIIKTKKITNNSQKLVLYISQVIHHPCNTKI
jgi:hypothetical protein